MRYKEAAANIGSNVQARTAYSGVYTGQLVEVLKEPKKPWRGLILINGVLKPARFEYGRRDLRGFRPGTVIEVGCVNIRLTEAVGATYLEAMERELREVDGLIEMLRPSGQDTATHHAIRRSLQNRIDEERRLQETNPQEETWK